MVNSNEIRLKAKNVELKYNLTHYEVLQRFMFERILERISISNYKDNFVLKGGLLLSAMFGVDNRTTKDIDATITGIDVSKEKMVQVLNEILNINIYDGVKFDVVNITDIREENEYGGNKYHIVGRLENLKVNLEIDISTGDKVTPRKLKFKFPLIFEERYISISSYNIETILSEKIETILRRGKFNSRMKDYYDVYYFLTNFRNEINKKVLTQAINNTFAKRKSLDYLEEYEQIINSINDSEKIKKLWIIYSKKYKYAQNIKFDEIIKLLTKILNEIEIKKLTTKN